MPESPDRSDLKLILYRLDEISGDVKEHRQETRAAFEKLDNRVSSNERQINIWRGVSIGLSAIAGFLGLSIGPK